MNTQTLPFLNKYFHELEYPYLTWHKGEKYNDAILVLDQGDNYSKMPYIEEMNSGIIRVLSKCFTTRPIHKTNRIKWSADGKEEIKKLISGYIKPKVLLSFSAKICREVEQVYPVLYKRQLEQTQIWKVFLEIDGKYFVMYALPGVSEMSQLPDDLTRFIVYTSAQRSDLCRQMNEIRKKSGSLNFPDDPLSNQKVQKSLKNLIDLGYPNLLNLNARAVEKTLQLVPDFDINDIIISSQLQDFMPFDTAQIPLTLKEYAARRKKQFSNEIAAQYIDAPALAYKNEIVQLSLLRLYFYLHYPDLSFEADWGLKMSYNMEMKDIIQGHVDSHKEMLRKMIRKNL